LWNCVSPSNDEVAQQIIDALPDYALGRTRLLVAYFTEVAFRGFRVISHKLLQERFVEALRTGVFSWDPTTILALLALVPNPLLAPLVCSRLLPKERGKDTPSGNRSRDLSENSPSTTVWMKTQKYGESS
jgi:hypothetical protein